MIVMSDSSKNPLTNYLFERRTSVFKNLSHSECYSTFEEGALCISPMGSVGETGMLRMSFDGIVQNVDQNFTFTNNPAITEVSPTSSTVS